MSTATTFRPLTSENVRFKNFTNSSDLNGLGYFDQTSDPVIPSLIIAAITFVLRRMALVMLKRENTLRVGIDTKRRKQGQDTPYSLTVLAQ